MPRPGGVGMPGWDIVYVGDYHTLRSAQQSYLALVRSAVASP